MPNPPQNFTSRLIKKEQLTQDAYSFYFAQPPTFEFIPGQYIKMALNIDNPDDRGVSRFFTIASSPTEKNYLMITTRILESSFKKSLGKLAVGDEAQMRGPHGAFVLDEKDTRPWVYLAGGIGITPARSMMVYSKNKSLNREMILLASFSTLDELIFEHEFNSLSNESRKIIFTITHPENSDWRGETGRIDSQKLKKYIRNITGSIYYISGPTTFVEAMERLVRSLGVADENIKTENFPGY